MIDKTNLRILKVLSQNARLSISQVAKRVHLSPPAVAERIKKMEESGVISGYAPLINLEKLGVAIEALIECEVHKTKEREFREYLLQVDEVIKIFNITGVTTFIVHVGVIRMSELDRVIEGMLDYCDTNTKLIMNMPLNNALPLRIDRVLQNKHD